MFGVREIKDWVTRADDIIKYYLITLFLLSVVSLPQPYGNVITYYAEERSKQYLF